MSQPLRVVCAWVTAHLDDERAASLVEYALLTALIALVCVAALVTFGQTNASKLLADASSIA